jgi:hypothetical protein
MVTTAPPWVGPQAGLTPPTWGAAPLIVAVALTLSEPSGPSMVTVTG